MATTNKPMIVVRDAEGRTLAILPQALSQDALTVIVQALQGFSTAELGPPTTIDRPNSGEREIIAAALDTPGGGKYAGKNPLATLLEGEPFFFLRAKDALAPGAVEAYGNILDVAARGILLNADARATNASIVASGLVTASEDVFEVANRMRGWQAQNEDLVKLPD